MATADTDSRANPYPLAPPAPGDLWLPVILHAAAHLVCVTALLVFLVVFVPDYERIFKDMGRALPVLTQRTIDASRFVVGRPFLTAFMALMFTAADAAVLWLLYRARQRRLAWAWSVLVVLGIVLILAAGMFGLHHAVVDMFRAMQQTS